MMRLAATGFFLSLAFVPLAQAQVGVTICACQPDVYEFTFNFSLICADSDVTSDLPGINDTSCKVNAVLNQNVTDLSPPVVVNTIQILELGQPPVYGVLSETFVTGPFFDGNKFNYTAVNIDPNDEASVPSGLQLSITGRDANEFEIIQFWSIIYDNNCGIFPLLTEGMKIGWTVFSDLGNPSQFICPAAPADGTESPSDAPSQVPTASPGIVTPAPTGQTASDAPSQLPTTPPGTSAPMAMPSSMPSTLCKTVGPLKQLDLRDTVKKERDPILEERQKLSEKEATGKSIKGSKSVKGTKSVKGGSKSSPSKLRSLRVGPRSPAPSYCPEPLP